MKSWANHIIYLWDRIKSFFLNPVIVMYFLCIVIMVGSFGVWYPYFDDDICKKNFFTSNGTLTNLSTYIISILAATMANFLLSEKPRGRGFKIFSFSTFILAFISAVMALIHFNSYFGYTGLFLTSLLWIIVFADDESLGGQSDDNANGGANPAQQIILGDLGGFKS